MLRPAQRAHPRHFHIAANLGTALQLHGDLPQAALCLEQAVRLAPGKYHKAEEYHLKLVRLRMRLRGEADQPDDLFGVRYVDDKGEYTPGKLAAAEKKKLPNLIELSDIKGDLHSHTTASDGVASIEQMAAAALARGYLFLAITDHSKSQAIANGLSVERLLKHAAAVRKAGDKLRGEIKLLAGSEVDILSDGQLDYEDSVLAELDYVVASPHFALTQDADKATARLLRAIENRHVNVIGHPTGRLIDRRAGLPIRFEPVFKLAAQTGTALEINSSYPRLDLNETNARSAIESGVMLSINTDAHSPDELDLIPYGINVARRAWATKKNVINCMSWEELNKFLARKR